MVTELMSTTNFQPGDRVKFKNGIFPDQVGQVIQIFYSQSDRQKQSTISVKFKFGFRMISVEELILVSESNLDS